jgi:hypothetical protein
MGSIKMSWINFVKFSFRLVAITLFCLLFLSNISEAKHDDYFSSNDKYVVLVENNHTLVVQDMETQTVIRKKFDFCIGNIELCPNHPFASFVAYEYDPVLGYQPREDFIYDLERNKIYSGYGIPENFKRWSPSGKYTYLQDSNSFLLIPTNYLREYLETMKKTKIIEITGNPEGFIEPLAWIGNSIIYVSGCCDEEIRCLGFFDTKKNKNYFLFCGKNLKGSKVKENYLVDIGSTDHPVEIFLERMRNKQIKEISNDFYNDVGRIIYGEKWEEDKRKRATEK